MKVFGLTGGIASGKSSVGNYFRELGAQIIDADSVVHQLYQQDENLKAQLIAEFGSEIVSSDGISIDRVALGNLIFNNPLLKKKLEDLVHPKVRSAIRSRIKELALQGHPLCLIDAALLVESGWYRDFDGLIVVSTTVEQQIERLMKRNQLDKAACLARLSSQAPLEEKIKQANWIIDNTGSLSDVQKQVAELYPQLL